MTTPEQHAERADVALKNAWDSSTPEGMQAWATLARAEIAALTLGPFSPLTTIPRHDYVQERPSRRIGGSA